jgi:hypothetical protein
MAPTTFLRGSMENCRRSRCDFYNRCSASGISRLNGVRVPVSLGPMASVSRYDWLCLNCDLITLISGSASAASI